MTTAALQRDVPASDTSEIDAGLMRYLAADPALSALALDGVWWQIAPPGATSFVVVDQLDSTDYDVLGGRLWERLVYLVQFVQREKTAGSSDPGAAALRIYQLLQDYTDLDVGSHYVVRLLRRIERIRYTEIDEVTDRRWQHRGGQYEVFAAPR